MEYLKLLGILIIVVGFVLKWDTTAVVVIAAIVTDYSQEWILLSCWK